MIPAIQFKHKLIFSRKKKKKIYLYVMKFEAAQFWSEFKIQRSMHCKERCLHEPNPFFSFAEHDPNTHSPAVLMYI